MDQNIKEAWLNYNTAANSLYTLLGNRSGNMVGEMAERLALDYYGGSLCKPSSKAYDLIDAQNRRIQVKSRKILNRNKMGNLGDIRNRQGADFDLLLVILFDCNGKVFLAKEFTRHQVSLLLSKKERDNARVISVSKIIHTPYGTKITEQFQTIFLQIISETIQKNL